MILRYAFLKRYPSIFVQLTGLDIHEFEAVFRAVLPAYQESMQERLSREDRQRSVGGGDHSELDIRDQVLLAMIWIRQHPRQETLGNLFAISRPTAWRYIRHIEPLLSDNRLDYTRRPDPGQKRRRDVAALVREIPGLLVLFNDLEKRWSRQDAS